METDSTRQSRLFDLPAQTWSMSTIILRTDAMPLKIRARPDLAKRFGRMSPI